MEGIELVYAFIGIPELLLILAIVFLLFGSSKLPALARAVGSAVQSFREGTKAEHEVEEEPEPREEQKKKVREKRSG